MKFFIAIACCLVFAAVANAKLADRLSEEQRTIVREQGRECLKELNLHVDDIAPIRAGNFENISHNTRCFPNCFLQRVGFIVDGVPQEAVITAKLGPIFGEDKLKLVYSKCNGIKAADVCETVLKLYQCYYVEGSALL